MLTRTSVQILLAEAFWLQPSQAAVGRRQVNSVTETLGSPLTGLTAFPNNLITDFDPNTSPIVGCYPQLGGTDGTTRILSGEVSFNQDQMTDEVCKTFCTTTATNAPYKYFGIAWGRDCYCGNTLEFTATSDPAQCIWPNSGDGNQAGGSDTYQNIWENVVVPSPLPLITDFQPYADYLGCLPAFDAANTAFFKGPSQTNSLVDHTSCLAFCNGATGGPYKFFAIQGGDTCQCTNSYEFGGATNDPTGCQTPTANNATEAGGSASGITAYLNTGYTPRLNIPNNRWVGCLENIDTNRVGADLLDGPVFPPSRRLTHTTCKSLCTRRSRRAPRAPYKYFAIENGDTCHCGNEFKHAPEMKIGECNTPCTGDLNESCGGRNRLAVWENEAFEEGPSPSPVPSPGPEPSPSPSPLVPGRPRPGRPPVPDYPPQWAGDGVDDPYFDDDNDYWNLKPGKPPGYRPDRPQSGYRPNKPQDGYRPNKPQDGYRPRPPQDGYKTTPPKSGYPTGSKVKRWLNSLKFW